MALVIEAVSDVEKKVFEYVSSNDINGLKTLFAQNKIRPDIFDEHGMTPLQHAAYKGNKEIAQMLLDHGADVGSGRHEHGYTALHFAALSGNGELCQILLAAGAKSHATNSLGRTPSQMAAFVGNHHCVAVINNFIPKSDVDYYTVPQGLEKEPKLPPVLAAPLHKFIMQVNVHPIRVALNLQPTLITQMPTVKKVLELMSAKEMRRNMETNEVMSFKLHYLAFVIGEVQRCRHPEKSTDPVELFAKKILRTGRGEEYLERFIRDCVREFPYRECAIFRQMVTSLARGSESPPALSVIRTAINGQRAFADNDTPSCSTCGEEKASKKCSKCKKVQYCDRECQRLQWFAHKKECERPITTQMKLLISVAVV
ncbi:ankyrin repeat and MYND domain-containing protein 2 [Lycorma delicatula]|uniref:ankyrin repeat and MYND domain-containing protein 2 n=1 Tax=Lycorma delicatula TaxID=130591 RepID=UPI003F50FF06